MERGGGKITLTGQGFLNFPTLACRFGLNNGSQQAQFVSSEHIQCLTPNESEPGIVNLEVTLNGFDYTTQTINFEFMTMAVLSQLAPEIGFTNGGVPVLLEGAGFAAIGRKVKYITCHWEMPGLDPREMLITRVSVMSDSVLTCLSPPASQPGNARVYIFADDVNIAETNEKALSFRYELRATSTKLFPAYGKPSGGTNINIIGDGFINGSELRCRFHSMPPGGRLAINRSEVVDVYAVFLSTTEVSCQSPALASIHLQGGDASDTGHALVEVSNREWLPGDFDSNRGLSFWYRQQPKASIAG